MDGDDDVPPLEDMSEAFTNCLKLREEKQSKVPVTRREVLEVPADAEKLQAKRIEKLLGKDDIDAEAKSKTETKKNVKKTDTPNTFCGFKKGFFNAPPKESTNNKPKTKKDAVPNVTKKLDENKNVFPEVQDAVKQQMPFLKSNDWVTEDLLAKIMSHPKLSKQFVDPRFSDVIQQFQSNPEQVMQMCANNPEMKEFVQDFCGIMGQHFTELGEKQDQKTSHINNKQSPTPHDSKQQTYPDDEKKMKAILSDPEIAAILNTTEIRKLIGWLKEDPEKAQRMLRSADAALRQKVQKLVDVGLLQMAV